MSQITRTELKAEALKRMKQLKLDSSVIEQFTNEDKIFYSERQNKIFRGILYWLDNEPEYVEALKTFEKEYGGLVYHCILTHTVFGTLVSMLYVSKHKEEWNMDMEDLKEGFPYAYVANLNDDLSSEIGSIQIKCVNGGVDRIG